MGERYDMDYVYYIDGNAWHGASDYYEYPCVFSWVLMHDYLGVGYDLEVDLALTPRISGGGSVELNQKRFALAYHAAPSEFRLVNLADRARNLRVDLSAVYPGASDLHLEQRGTQITFQNGWIVRLEAGESCRFTLEKTQNACPTPVEASDRTAILYL